MDDFERQNNKTKDDISSEESYELFGKNTLKTIIFMLVGLLCVAIILTIARTVISIAISVGILLLVFYGIYRLMNYFNDNEYADEKVTKTEATETTDSDNSI